MWFFYFFKKLKTIVNPGEPSDITIDKLYLSSSNEDVYWGN